MKDEKIIQALKQTREKCKTDYSKHIMDEAMQIMAGVRRRHPRKIDADRLSLHLADFALAVAPDERDDREEKIATAYDLARCRYETIQECMRAVDDAEEIE